MKIRKRIAAMGAAIMMMTVASSISVSAKDIPGYEGYAYNADPWIRGSITLNNGYVKSCGSIGTSDEKRYKLKIGVYITTYYKDSKGVLKTISSHKKEERIDDYGSIQVTLTTNPSMVFKYSRFDNSCNGGVFHSHILRF